MLVTSSFHRTALACLVLVGGLAACAPRAEPARGEIGDQVAAAIADGTGSFDHSAWNDLLAGGTVAGMVDYDYFRDHEAQLDAYLADLAEADLDSLTGNELKALLINAYNAYTIRSILDHPGVASIREIDGVWDTRTHPVGGFDLTLDNIEHNLLRPFFKDPRIHVAVNCASRSCAPLPPWAFEGASLDRQLDDWTRAFFSNPRYSRIEGDTYWVSKLLEWYGDDFLAPDAEPRADSLVAFAARYAAGDLGRQLDARGDDLELRFLDYDWSLNEARVAEEDAAAPDSRRIERGDLSASRTL